MGNGGHRCSGTDTYGTVRILRRSVAVREEVKNNVIVSDTVRKISVESEMNTAHFNAITDMFEIKELIRA